MFDMVIDRMDPVRVEHSLLDGGGGGGAGGGGTAGGGQAGLAPTMTAASGNRRWDATPAPAALARRRRHSLNPEPRDVPRGTSLDIYRVARREPLIWQNR